jgi:hypothetical protein
MDHFYSGQVRRYLTQYIRAMSNFSWKDNSGRLNQVPVMYGDPSRQASAILKKNSENIMPTAPFIACYIKGLDYDQSRLQDPTFVSKVQIREREFDESTGQYLNTQGLGYTVERIMPSPYKLTFSADIWTTNTEQKLQIFEQIAYLFNPSLELQTTDNFIDWTSLTVLQLESTNWTSRQVPQGVEQNIDILTMTFTTPIWITPPAKVMKMGIITKIIANVFADQEGTIMTDYSDDNAVYSGLGNLVSTTVVTPGNFELMVLDGVGSLLTNEIHTAADDDVMPGNTVSWRKLLDLYPGQFRANLSTLRLSKPNGHEIVAYISLDPYDERRMLLNFDTDTIPANTPITNRPLGTVDAVINPETFSPGTPVTNVTYLILENINVVPEYGQLGYSGPVAWKNSNGHDFQAHANDIIQWNGIRWNVIFNSSTVSDVTYITNSYTGIQYKWDGQQWSKSFEGIYDNLTWRLVL